MTEENELKEMKDYLNSCLKDAFKDKEENKKFEKEWEENLYKDIIFLSEYEKDQKQALEEVKFHRYKG